ncbi:MAG: MBL fold metallo-hydrolase, partial [Flavobacteriaceae bacterium]|nr:MBL fold metallo-hydrolase [Flavobacteriaceae bacterium]
MKSDLTITFLGTGTSQGIPIIGTNHPVCLSTNPKDNRLRVSVLLEWESNVVVTDCGPDFRQQMLRENVTKLGAVLLTHEHSDHVAGIDDIRPYCFINGPIPFYAHSRVFESLHRRYDYIFKTENRYPGSPTIIEEEITKEASFFLFGKEVVPIEAMHANLPVLGFRIDGFTYLTDVKTISDTEIEKIKGTEVLVLNVLKEESHFSHLNVDEAMEIIEKVEPKTTYFTHISHKMGFHDEAEGKLPE